MLELGLKALLSYLMGSLNGSLVLGNLTRGPDIRTVGSGNAGGTNALRARGKWFALWVMAIDIGKGFVAVAWLVPIVLVQPDPAVSREWLAMACAAAVIIGHCYPVWFGFIGGKGAATGVGVILGLAPWLLLPAFVTWLLVVGMTGFVGLATILAAASLPVLLSMRLFQQTELFVFVLLLALFILYTHRGNVVRMLRREENRMPKLMILRRSR